MMQDSELLGENSNNPEFVREKVYTARERMYFFWLACIPVRSLYALLIYYHPVPLFAIISFVQAAGFAYNYHKDSKRAVGDRVGNFGGYVWWHYDRLLHTVLYIIGGLLIFYDKNFAFIPYVIDVTYGAFSWVHHYYMTG